MVAGVAQYVELHVEELFKFEPVAGALHLVGIVGVVHPAYGLVARHEPQALGKKGRKGLFERSGEAFQQAARYFLHGARGEPRLLHLLGSVVVGLHTHAGELQVLGRLYLRVCYLETPAVDRGPSEHDVGHAGAVGLGDVLGACEPNKVYDAGRVGEVGHKAFVAGTIVEEVETQYLTLQLHEGHVGVQFAHRVDAAPVHILVGVVLQQVAEGLDAEFGLKYLLARGSYPRCVHHVLFQYVGHKCCGWVLFSAYEL